MFLEGELIVGKLFEPLFEGFGKAGRPVQSETVRRFGRSHDSVVNSLGLEDDDVIAFRTHIQERYSKNKDFLSRRAENHKASYGQAVEAFYGKK